MNKTIQSEFIEGFNSEAIPLNDLSHNFWFEGSLIKNDSVFYRGVEYKEFYIRDENGNVVGVSRWTPDHEISGAFLLLGGTSFLLLTGEMFLLL